MTSEKPKLSQTGPIPAVQQIERVCLELKINASRDQMERLAEYCRELLLWNTKVNLTGARTISRFINGPLFDALTVMPVFRQSGTLVDIGSGGGLPGVPMTLLSPDITTVLVEPRAKRAAFLSHIVHQLGIPAEVRVCRAEKLNRRFQGAVAQAVWEPPKWLERALTLGRPGGFVYVLSSREVSLDPFEDALELDDQFECRQPETGAKRFSYRIKIK